MRKNFLPGPETTLRRITPTEFAHLRKWVEEVKRNVKIVSISEMTNINQQLEQNAEMFVNNIISRVIAQLIGKYGDGFVTLEATADGKLKVEADLLAAGTVGLEAGSELIGKVEVAGTSQTVERAAITNVTGSHTSIIALAAGKQIKIVNIMFTVTDECGITFESHETAISGEMEFGDTDEPRGMVHHFGNCPLCTVSGERFSISVTGAGALDGYVTYYTE